MSINGLNRNNSLDRIVGNFTTAGVSAPGADIRTPGDGNTYLVYKTVGSHDLTVSSTQGWTQRSKVITTTPGGSAPAIPGTNVHAFVLGGGGGGWYSSAAGAGGAVEHPTYDISPYGSSAIPIVVGDGGYSVPAPFSGVSVPTSGPNTIHGGTSEFGHLLGLGGNGAGQPSTAHPLGNGCGGSNRPSSQPSLTHPGSNPGYSNYGNNGGSPAYYSNGGGGGTGAVGPNGTASGYTNSTNAPTAGGAGRAFPAFPYTKLGVNSDPNGGSNHYGGGGGGGSAADGWVNNSGNPGQPGGIGGGGASGKHNGGNCHPGACASEASGSGIDNLGGGGGGVSGHNQPAGGGGSGLVVIKYTT